MNRLIEPAVAGWLQRRELKFYPAVKRLTLEIAADIFLYVQLRSEIDKVGNAFFDLVEASNAIKELRDLARVVDPSRR